MTELSFGGQLFLEAWNQASDNSKARVARLALGQEWIGIKTSQMDAAVRALLSEHSGRWPNDRPESTHPPRTAPNQRALLP